MNSSYFGTDGIRGRAGASLPPELALRAAAAYASLLPGQRSGSRQQVVVGGDSRLSTPMLRAAVTSGLMLGGVEVVDIGTVPTPLVPFALMRLKAAGGVMVTASHNPVPDNGLKFFDADGIKIDASMEHSISKGIDAPGWRLEPAREQFGQIRQLDIVQPYLASLVRHYAVAGAGLSVVLDCAHGAAAELGPLAFAACGHGVTALHATFDGRRVNVNSGTTNLAALGRAVKRAGAQLGIAFDGDGDRMLAVDNAGRAVTGDRIIALFASQLPRYRRQGSVVMTHMTNLGVEQALLQRRVAMVRTDVGDAKVLAAMRERSLHLGGEQSGHIIMRDRLPTGDGIAAGLQLASLVSGTGRLLSELVAGFNEYPQELKNLVVRDRKAWQSDKRLQSELAQIRRRFPEVRFYLRASGTENLLRVLTEAQDAVQCRQANAAICDAIREWDAR